ncbi:MAG: hypothetical protein OER04_11970 [Cyclobacteriaceae bacterium]|nr:hypothetical protein [Cyclobacteriaceae bacterium]
MDTKKFVMGTVVGGIVYFLLGFVFYGVLFEGFFTANAGSATGVMNTEMAWWPLILGNLALAALITYIFLNWAGITTFAGGLKGGALIGFLMAVSFDMIMLDTTNIMTLNAALVDILIATIMGAIAGGIIGAVLGSGKQSAAAS